MEEELLIMMRIVKGIRNSLLFKKPSFRNAIIQNIVGGNTMVFNNPAKKLSLSPLIEAQKSFHTIGGAIKLFLE